MHLSNLVHLALGRTFVVLMSLSPQILKSLLAAGVLLAGKSAKKTFDSGKSWN
jgi:hypothetical protein